MSNSKVEVKLIDGGVIPTYESTLAGGCDLSSIEEVTVLPDEVVGIKLDSEGNEVECSFNDPDAIRLHVKRHPVVIRTGVMVALPVGAEMEIRGRSGLGFKYEVIPFYGTIDADYRGEIKLKIFNIGSRPFHIKKGMRVAQGVITQVLQPTFVQVDDLSETVRGENGFDSTGLF